MKTKLAEDMEEEDVVDLDDSQDEEVKERRGKGIEKVYLLYGYYSFLSVFAPCILMPSFFFSSPSAIIYSFCSLLSIPSLPIYCGIT